MDGDVTALEWDEDGLTMTVWLDENPDESGKAHVRLLDPMLLYRLVRSQDFETDEEEQERLDAEARAENRAEDEAMEAHYERKYGAL